MDKADQFINRVGNLPPAPTIATELLEILGDPNQRVDQFVDLIRHDPALTAKIMQRCNTGYFRGAEPATDMFEVIMRLGFYEVYCVVATQLGGGLLTLAKGAPDPHENLLWRHSVMTAVAASELALHLAEPAAPAFTAGLLHDLGKQVFATVEPLRYAELTGQVEMFGLNRAERELEYFGVDHTVIGAQLLRRWSLPESIAAAVQGHHGQNADGQRLTALVQVANSLAYELAGGAEGVDDVTQFQPNPIQLLGLTTDDIPPLLTQVQFGLQRVEGFSMHSFTADI
jgi:putative nucleotidyltransferase with HDIG domain